MSWHAVLAVLAVCAALKGAEGANQLGPHTLFDHYDREDNVFWHYLMVNMPARLSCRPPGEAGRKKMEVRWFVGEEEISEKSSWVLGWNALNGDLIIAQMVTRPIEIRCSFINGSTTWHLLTPYNLPNVNLHVRFHTKLHFPRMYDATHKYLKRKCNGNSSDIAPNYIARMHGEQFHHVYEKLISMPIEHCEKVQACQMYSLDLRKCTPAKEERAFHVVIYMKFDFGQFEPISGMRAMDSARQMRATLEHSYNQLYPIVPKVSYVTWWITTRMSASLDAQCLGYSGQLKNGICQLCASGSFGRLKLFPWHHRKMRTEQLKACELCPAGTYAEFSGMYSCSRCPKLLMRPQKNTSIGLTNFSVSCSAATAYNDDFDIVARGTLPSFLAEYLIRQPNYRKRLFYFAVLLTIVLILTVALIASYMIVDANRIMDREADKLRRLMLAVVELQSSTVLHGLLEERWIENLAKTDIFERAKVRHEGQIPDKLK